MTIKQPNFRVQNGLKPKVLFKTTPTAKKIAFFHAVRQIFYYPSEAQNTLFYWQILRFFRTKKVITNFFENFLVTTIYGAKVGITPHWMGFFRRPMMVARPILSNGSCSLTAVSDNGHRFILKLKN